MHRDEAKREGFFFSDFSFCKHTCLYVGLYKRVLWHVALCIFLKTYLNLQRVYRFKSKNHFTEQQKKKIRGKMGHLNDNMECGCNPVIQTSQIVLCYTVDLLKCCVSTNAKVYSLQGFGLYLIISIAPYSSQPFSDGHKSGQGTGLNDFELLVVRASFLLCPYLTGSIGTCGRRAVAMVISRSNPSGICHLGKQAGREPAGGKRKGGAEGCAVMILDLTDFFNRKVKQESLNYAREAIIQFCLGVRFKSTSMDASMERQRESASLDAFCLGVHIEYICIE